MQLSPIAPTQLASFPIPFPGGPGHPSWRDMYNAVHGVTPTPFTPAEDELLASIALHARLDADVAAATIRAAYNATPSVFDIRQNLLVLAAATLAKNADTAGVAKAAYTATPAALNPDQTAAVIAAALLSRIPATEVTEIVKRSYAQSPTTWSPEQNTSAMLGSLFLTDANPKAEELSLIHI